MVEAFAPKDKVNVLKDKSLKIFLKIKNENDLEMRVGLKEEERI